MDVIKKALDMGIIDSVDQITPNQFSVIKFFVRMMEIEDLHDYSAGQIDIDQMTDEISNLNDILDLEDCDRVEPGKSFFRSESRINIPLPLVSFVNTVVLPTLREVVEKGP